MRVWGPTAAVFTAVALLVCASCATPGESPVTLIGSAEDPVASDDVSPEVIERLLTPGLFSSDAAPVSRINVCRGLAVYVTLAVGSGAIGCGR